MISVTILKDFPKLISLLSLIFNLAQEQHISLEGIRQKLTDIWKEASTKHHKGKHFGANLGVSKSYNIRLKCSGNTWFYSSYVPNSGTSVMIRAKELETLSLCPWSWPFWEFCRLNDMKFQSHKLHQTSNRTVCVGDIWPTSVGPLSGK